MVGVLTITMLATLLIMLHFAPRRRQERFSSGNSDPARNALSTITTADTPCGHGLGIASPPPPGLLQRSDDVCELAMSHELVAGRSATLQCNNRNTVLNPSSGKGSGLVASVSRDPLRPYCSVRFTAPVRDLPRDNTAAYFGYVANNTPSVKHYIEQADAAERQRDAQRQELRGVQGVATSTRQQTWGAQEQHSTLQRRTSELDTGMQRASGDERSLRRAIGDGNVEVKDLEKQLKRRW